MLKHMRHISYMEIFRDLRKYAERLNALAYIAFPSDARAIHTLFLGRSPNLLRLFSIELTFSHVALLHVSVGDVLSQPWVSVKTVRLAQGLMHVGSEENGRSSRSAFGAARLLPRLNDEQSTGKSEQPSQQQLAQRHTTSSPRPRRQSPPTLLMPF